MIGARHEVIEQDMRRIVSAPLPWEDLRGKTVLITGRQGFSRHTWRRHRSFLTRPIRLSAFAMIAPVRNESRARARFAHYEGRDDLTLLMQDASSRNLST